MEELVEKIKSCKDKNKASEILYSYAKKGETLEKALELSIHYHHGQYRKSGEEYVVHPILVAAIVAYFGGDEEMIVAALLHDVVEDTECSSEEIGEHFGQGTQKLVEGLTKIVEIRDKNLIPSYSDEKIIASALSFRKMLLVSISDVRVLVIKLCDRLHNMLTISALPPHKQKRISEETLVVYAPIAHRLGISSMKNYLEDLSFCYVMPQEYKKIDRYLTSHSQQLQLKLNHFISKIKQLMLKNGFIYDDFVIHKRIKHYYSIYLKMQRKGISIEEVLDLLAIRILVKKEIDCYKALGIVHLNFNPLISRFKDYIAVAKENGYQTIHTTVFDEKSIIEAQIRTFDMHKTAEFGVAAHWKYKSSGLSPKLEWLNELKTQNEISENIEEFYEIAKHDLYSEDISVFSPKGDVFTLPRGATALDFAYAVHTEIGDHTKEAYINKQKAPLLTELKNGDIVKIVTSKEPRIRCSWLESLKTAKAKNAIRTNCKLKIKEINQKIAIDLLLGIFSVDEKKLFEWLKSEGFEKNIHKAAIDSSYFIEVVNHLKKYETSDRVLFPIFKFNKYKIKKQKFDSIVVYSNQNISNVLFDYCCHPKRGDDIVGFKKASVVTIHHKFCEKTTKLIEKKEPMAFVKWSKDIPSRYKLLVIIENKKGSLASFLQFLAKMDINVVTIQLGQNEDVQADFFELILEFPDKNTQKIKDNIKEKYKVIELVPVDDVYKEVKGI